MAKPLQEYLRKRDFNATPRAGRQACPPTAGSRVAVLHPEARRQPPALATFAWSWMAPLKSWAIPKGPSLDPKVRRLAVHVEDHPLDYASFEGAHPSKATTAPAT